jgi:hypothetical protein
MCENIFQPNFHSAFGADTMPELLFQVFINIKNLLGFYESVYEWRGLYERKVGFLVHLHIRTYICFIRPQAQTCSRCYTTYFEHAAHLFQVCNNRDLSTAPHSPPPFNSPLPHTPLPFRLNTVSILPIPALLQYLPLPSPSA